APLHRLPELEEGDVAVRIAVRVAEGRAGEEAGRGRLLLAQAPVAVGVGTVEALRERRVRARGGRRLAGARARCDEERRDERDETEDEACAAASHHGSGLAGSHRAVASPGGGG